tara:strand:- start:269 stop:502 length:234 start_codon:yes stop_codon:yes gene_type:complete
MDIKLAEMDLKKILAAIFLSIGLFPFVSSYSWFTLIGKGRLPKRQSGKFYLLYMAISMLFVFIGLRLLLGPPKKKNK